MPPKKRKCFLSCSVVDCKNTTSNSAFEFYSFPTSNTLFPHKALRRQNWLTAVRRQEPDGSPWNPSRENRICSCHFIGNKKSENPLSPSYNPTIFPTIYKKSTTFSVAATERFQRRLKRIQTQSVKDNPTNPKVQKLDRLTNNFCEINIQEELSDHVPVKCDAETQVDFLEVDDSVQCRVFICNMCTDGTSCSAQTQFYSPSIVNKKVILETPILFEKIGADSQNRQNSSQATEKRKKVTQNEKIKCTTGFHGYSDVKDRQQLTDLAGVTIESFQLLLKILARDESIKFDARLKLTREDRLLLFLVKMKCGLTFSAMSALFGVHRTTISKIFYHTLTYLAAACQNFVMWPTREAVEATMPKVFKESYSKCRAIIDCTEFQVEQPATLERRVHFFSHYKHGFRLKILVACTPSGMISFVSKCLGGRASDPQITNCSGFLDLLEPGDLILADKGFPHIQTKLDENGRGVLIVMPPFLHNGTFSEEEVDKTYEVAKVRIHIERIMQRIRTFKIVDKFTTEMLPFCNDIVFMCCVLVNLQPPIMKETDISENQRFIP